MYLGMDLFEFILLGSLLSFLDVSIRFGTFSTIISSNILPASSSCLAFGTPIIFMLVCVVVSHSLLSCVHFSSFFFLPAPQTT